MRLAVFHVVSHAVLFHSNLLFLVVYRRGVASPPPQSGPRGQPASCVDQQEPPPQGRSPGGSHRWVYKQSCTAREGGRALSFPKEEGGFQCVW